MMLNAFAVNVFDVNVFAVSSKTINILVDGTYIGGKDKPFIEDNRTLVPVRAVTEKMGAEIF